MPTIEELKEMELKSLSEEDEEIFELESLITDGADAKIPVTISYPRPDGRMVKGAVLIRPLTNVEWNNAVRFKRKPGDNTTNEVELLKLALYNKDGEQFPPDLVEKLPNGVVLELVKEVSRVSGINWDENLKLAQKMMGFSI